MAQYFWTAEDYDLNTEPTDVFTAHGNIESFLIEEDVDGKHIRYIALTDGERSFLSFLEDQIYESDVEIFIKLKIGGGGSDWGVFSRTTLLSDIDNVSIYRGDFNERSDNNRISEFDKGSFSSFQESSPHLPTQGVLGFGVSRSDGSSLFFKSWNSTDPEPSTWTMEQNNIEQRFGVCGINAFRANASKEIKVYEFSVGTRGDVAPRSKSEIVNTPTLLQTTPSDTSADIEWSVG